MKSPEEIPAPSIGVVVDENGNCWHAEIQLRTVAGYIGQVHEKQKLSGDELQRTLKLISPKWS